MKEDKIRNENTVPLLDLAPRLKRPLSLWNPLDYLRLLYWAFFFPQAIRWYVDIFGSKDNLNKDKIKNSKETKKQMSNSPIPGKLIIQSIIILFLFANGTLLIFEVPDRDFLQIIFVIYLLIFLIVIRNVALCLAIGLSFMIIVTARSILKYMFKDIFIMIFVYPFTFYLFAGLVLSVAVGTRKYVFGSVTRIYRILIITLGGGGIVIAGLTDPKKLLSFSEPLYIAVIPLIIAILFIFMMRLPEYILVTLYLSFYKRSKKIEHLPYLVLSQVSAVASFI